MLMFENWKISRNIHKNLTSLFQKKEHPWKTTALANQSNAVATRVKPLSHSIANL